MGGPGHDVESTVKPKFCVECRHHKLEREPYTFGSVHGHTEQHYCARPYTRVSHDLVTGELIRRLPTQCTAERLPAQHFQNDHDEATWRCGPSAKFFEAKQ